MGLFLVGLLAEVQWRFQVSVSFILEETTSITIVLA